MKGGSSRTDAELLLHVQRNDEQALALLMRRHYDALYNYASRFSSNHSLIKDCIQEVFISLWQKRETAHQIMSPRYYLLRAIKNKTLKALYKDGKRVLNVADHSEDSYYEFSIEQVIIERQSNEDKARKVRKVIGQLSKKQKEIVYLKYFQFLDHAQIAELMNLNRQSVYNLLHETIRRMRQLLEGEFINQ